MRKIKIAIASTTSLPERLDHNLAQIKEMAAKAAADGADILLTPELSATGYGSYPEIIAAAEVAGQGNIYHSLADTAEKSGVIILAGFVEKNGDARHIAHYIVYPDRSFRVQRKHRITSSERPLNPSVELSPDANGELGQPLELRFEIFEVKGVKCAISICADAGIEGLYEHLTGLGVDLVFGPTGAGGVREDRVVSADLKTESGLNKYLDLLESVFFSRSGVENCIRYRIALAAVNMCGYDGKKHYHLGHGMIINPMGEVRGFFHGLPNLDRQRPMYAAAEIDVDERLD